MSRSRLVLVVVAVLARIRIGHGRKQRPVFGERQRDVRAGAWADQTPLFSIGGAVSYVTAILCDRGGVDAFRLSTRECGAHNACSILPSGGQLLTARAEWRPSLVGPLGAFVQLSAGIARMTIGEYESGQARGMGDRSPRFWPGATRHLLLLRVFGSEVVLGSVTGLGGGVELGGSF